MTDEEPDFEFVAEDEEVTLDRRRGHGSGSWSDGLYDETAITKSDSANPSSASTHISDSNGGILRSKEARESVEGDTSDRISWKHLSDLHRGLYTEGRSQNARKAGQNRDLLTMASRFELTELQKERAIKAYEEYDFDRAGVRTSEEIALACLTLAANKDGRALRGGVASEEDRSLFEEICEAKDVDPMSIRAVRKELQDTDSESSTETKERSRESDTSQPPIPLVNDERERYENSRRRRMMGGFERAYDERYTNIGEKEDLVVGKRDFNDLAYGSKP